MRPRWTSYDSTLRRRARQFRRVAHASLTPSFYPSAPVLPAYWWDGHPNFGDALTPWLLYRYGRVPVHSAPARASLCGVGSILEHLPREFSGTVWGSGLLYGERVDLPDARFAAVRGELTRDVQGITGPVALGDPGLLVSRHVRRGRTRWRLGVVPHGMHRDDPTVAEFARRHVGQVKVFDTAHPVDVVVRGIARCDAVVSSSLHGLVIADSFGIPAAWFELEPALWGADFKFRDYESVVTPGRSRRIDLAADSTPGTLERWLQRADADRVSSSITDLERALTEADIVRRLPFLAWQA